MKNMDAITISKKELKITIKESVREVLQQELMEFRALLLPSVSKKEQMTEEEVDTDIAIQKYIRKKNCMEN